jgi:hypothetical protein
MVHKFLNLQSKEPDVSEEIWERHGVLDRHQSSQIDMNTEGYEGANLDLPITCNDQLCAGYHNKMPRE